MSDEITIEIDELTFTVTEQIAAEAGDLTEPEMHAISRLAGDRLLMVGDEPTVLFVAACLAMRLTRDRKVTTPQLEALIEILGAWLAGELAEVTS